MVPTPPPLRVMPALSSERVSFGAIGVLLALCAAASMTSRLFLRRAGLRRVLVGRAALSATGLAVMPAPLPLRALADDATARAVIDRCYSVPHLEGELDERVVGFYQELRAIYPDHPPYDPDVPWALMPLDTGIDHVFMNISYSADDAVNEAIERLATQHASPGRR